MWTLITVAGICLVLLVVQWLYLAIVMFWTDQKTDGLNYYGLSPDERQRFKSTLRTHAKLLSPVLALLSKFKRVEFSDGSFEFEGVAGPRGTCSVDTFRRGSEYQPAPNDVFVVTQMRCGTTWMQHLVYQVLTRGAGDLVQEKTTLNAVSPWLESRKSVSVEEAPLVGETKSRIIKTHLPAKLCPHSDQSKYIYVIRHPASCFASCVDFVRNNLAGFEPPLEVLQQWFVSDRQMWWNTWVDHWTGWWKAAQGTDNVIFVRFEDMVADLPAVIRQLGCFLQVANLNDSEVARIAEKCSFDYMREHADCFEMHAPHLLLAADGFFISGKAERHQTMPPETRQAISSWAAEQLAASDLPVAEFYADIAVSPEVARTPQ